MSIVPTQTQYGSGVSRRCNQKAIVAAGNAINELSGIPVGVKIALSQAARDREALLRLIQEAITELQSFSGDGPFAAHILTSGISHIEPSSG